MDFELKNLNHRPSAPEWIVEYKTAAADGVSFPSIPRALPVAFMTVAFGTSSICGIPHDELFWLRGVRLEFSSPSPEVLQVSFAERYAKLRRDIVAAGIELLTDEQVREEIRERRGLISEIDS